MSEESLSVDSVQHYEQRRANIESRIGVLRAKDDRLGYVRVGLFFAALLFGGLGFFADSSTAFLTLAGLCLAAFLAVVIVNEPIRDQIAEFLGQRKVTDQLIARQRRDWSAIAKYSAFAELPRVDLSADQRAVAEDLDFFGKASLFRFVSMTATRPGTHCLIQWMAGAAGQSSAEQRYDAAERLAPRRDQRTDFYVRARTIGDATGNPTQFTEWAEGSSWLASRGWLLFWANVSAVIAVLLMLAVLAGLLGITSRDVVRTSSLGLLILGIVNILLGALVLAPAHKIFSIAMTSRRSVQQYQELFGFAELLSQTEASSNPLVDGILDRLLTGEASAKAGMSALSGVARAGGLKQSAATFLLYLPLQMFGLWDLRVLRRLESWQESYGAHCRGWFESLGELEALMSVAAQHDEQPEWSRPAWTDEVTVVASRLGHPLLPSDVCVCNDVTLGPPGSLLLVTGSNMSGKSTLLRSLGLNVALAAVGGKVCASSFSLASLELATSIRVSDSLADGVSFYMAELQRLKSVVDHARRLANDPNRVVLFLLDEILQGTNSRERQIAVAQVLRHLIDSGAIGAISTHDLELADEPTLASIAHTVHFRETITPNAKGGEQMTFDYQMRDGVSPTTNALRLLEMVGLGQRGQEL